MIRSNSRSILAIALAAVLTCSTAPVWASPKPANVVTTKSKAGAPSPTSVQTVATAYELVRYGDAHHDAVALIAAARMLKDIGTRPSNAKREGSATTQTKAGEDRLAVENILARARTLSAGRADLLALADDVDKGGTRGTPTGVSRWRELVKSGDTDVYRLTYRGGERAAFAVSGDGDSDLDLYVLDANGNLVCKDEGNSDDALCQWEPKWTGEFRILIKNRGVANQYAAAHN